MLFTWTLVLTILAVIVWKFIHEHYKFRQLVNRIPGPKVDSILWGNLTMFWYEMKRFRHESIHVKMKETNRFAMELFSQYREQGLLRLWIGPVYPVIILLDADKVQQLLTSTQNIDKAKFYSFLRPWLGDGLLLADAKIWRPKRKLITNAFHFKVLESFLPIFARHTKHLMEKIAEQLNLKNNSIFTDDNKCIDIEDIRLFYEDLTLNVINETAMGIDFHENNAGNRPENQAYILAMKQVFRRVSTRLLQPFYWIDFLFKFSQRGRNFFHSIRTMHQYSDKIIEKRLAEFEMNSLDQNNNYNQLNSEKNPNIFLNLLLKHYNRKIEPIISKEAMRSEVNTFILGGHDTTAMALTFTTLLLGHHPLSQNRARKEIQEIVGEKTEISWTHLKSLHYLEMCIKESLRLFPSIRIIGRTLTEPLILNGGDIILPAKTECFVPIFSINRDEHYYYQANCFIPERFETVQKHPFAYLPFSAGPRNCIGQKYAMLEVKFVLATILRKFRIHSLTKIDDVYPELSPVLKPCVKISIQLECLQKEI